VPTSPKLEAGVVSRNAFANPQLFALGLGGTLVSDLGAACSFAVGLNITVTEKN
jgi:hypothetical protein